MVTYDEMRANFTKTNRTCPLRKIKSVEVAVAASDYVVETLECGHSRTLPAYGRKPVGRRRRCEKCRDDSRSS